MDITASVTSFTPEKDIRDESVILNLKFIKTPVLGTDSGLADPSQEIINPPGVGVLKAGGVTPPKLLIERNSILLGSKVILSVKVVIIPKKNFNIGTLTS